MLTLALWPQRSSWRSTLPRHSAIQHPGEPQTENQGWREWQVSRRSVLYPVCCVTDQFLPRIIWFCNEYSLDQDNISRCMHVKKYTQIMNSLFEAKSLAILYLLIKKLVNLGYSNRNRCNSRHSLALVSGPGQDTTLPFMSRWWTSFA